MLLACAKEWLMYWSGGQEFHERESFCKWLERTSLKLQRWLNVRWVAPSVGQRSFETMSSRTMRRSSISMSSSAELLAILVLADVT